MTTSAGTKVELLPCPFCGCEAATLLEVKTGKYKIWCLRPTQKCGAVMVADTIEEIERTWNRRGAPSAPVQAGELVKRLREYADDPTINRTVNFPVSMIQEIIAEIERLSAAATVEPATLPAPISDLAMMLRRMIWQIRKRDVNDDTLAILASKGDDLLRLFRLQGSPLRKGDELEQS